jgi:hypothetical protein
MFRKVTFSNLVYSRHTLPFNSSSVVLRSQLRLFSETAKKTENDLSSFVKKVTIPLGFGGKKIVKVGDLEKGPVVVTHNIQKGYKFARLTEEQKKEICELRLKDPATYTPGKLGRMYNVPRLFVASFAKAPPEYRKKNYELQKEKKRKEEEEKQLKKERLQTWYNKHLLLEYIHFQKRNKPYKQEYEEYKAKMKEAQQNSSTPSEKVPTRSSKGPISNQPEKKVHQQTN